MKILIDMNLSPDWVKVLEHAGWEAVHWSTVGDMRAPDDIIMSWARENGYIVFTHDLDFGVLLALTRAESPSVIQVRTQDVFPDVLGDRLSSRHENTFSPSSMKICYKRRTRLTQRLFLIWCHEPDQ